MNPTRRLFSKVLLELETPLANSLSDLCRRLGLKSLNATSKKNVRRTLQEYGIPTEHFTTYHAKLTTPKKPWSQHLVQGKSNSARILRRCLQEMGRELRCQDCGLADTWNGKPLTLQVDHVNADNSDNRPENLRFLCPNCHSQTDTWGNKMRDWEDVLCRGCDRPTGHRKAVGKSYARAKKSFCTACLGVNQAKRLKTYVVGRFHTIWPSDTDLGAMLQNRPATQVAKELGVSSVAIKKHCNRQNIPTPGRGYWAKVAAGKVSIERLETLQESDQDPTSLLRESPDQG